MSNRGKAGMLDAQVMRLLRLARRLGEGRPVTSAYIRETYGVSRATAKRDLVRLETALAVRVEEDRRPGVQNRKTLYPMGHSI